MIPKQLSLLRAVNIKVTHFGQHLVIREIFGGAISAMFGALRVTNSKLNTNRLDATTILAMGGAIYSFACYSRVSDAEMNNNTVSDIVINNIVGSE